MYVYDNKLYREFGEAPLGAFSSHWAACAAMIRMSNPNFKSLGGDKVEDLAIEAAIERKL